jgi:hypothetical protein
LPTKVVRRGTDEPGIQRWRIGPVGHSVIGEYSQHVFAPALRFSRDPLN